MHVMHAGRSTEMASLRDSIKERVEAFARREIAGRDDLRNCAVVPPDLLETMNTVLAMSILASIARTWAGSVESSTCSFGKPAFRAKVSASTSGPKLDPPMPSTTASENFCPFTRLA